MERSILCSQARQEKKSPNRTQIHQWFQHSSVWVCVSKRDREREINVLSKCNRKTIIFSPFISLDHQCWILTDSPKPQSQVFFSTKHSFIPDWNILHHWHWFCSRPEPANTSSIFLWQDSDLFIGEKSSITHLWIIAWKYYTLPKVRSTTASWFYHNSILNFWEVSCFAS